MTRKKLLFIAVPAGALLLFLALIALARSSAESYLIHQIESAGLKPVTIGQIGVAPGSFIAKDIKIGPYEFSSIQSISGDISWLPFLLGGKMDNVVINGLRLNDQMNSLSDLLSPTSFLDAEKIKSLPFNQVSIRNAQYDVATPYGNLRIDGNIVIHTDEDGEKTIEAALNASQFQLSFETNWTGKTTADNSFLLDGDILEAKMNFGPLRASRTSGWISLKTKDGLPSLSGEIEAGSGSVFSIPVQDISFVLGSQNNVLTLLLRSDATGTKDVKLYADLSMSAEKTDFNLTLDIGNVSEFITFLSNIKDIKKETPNSLEKIGKTSLSLSYLSARRFAGGPLPFEIKATGKETDILEGHFLVYPDNLDIRGSAETSEDIAAALQKYFDIPDEKVTGTALRLDGNLKEMFKPDPSGIGAGIEDNLGE